MRGRPAFDGVDDVCSGAPGRRRVRLAPSGANPALPPCPCPPSSLVSGRFPHGPGRGRAGYAVMRVILWRWHARMRRRWHHLIPHARVLRRIRELCRPAPGGTCFSGGAPAWRRRGCALAARRPGSRIHNMGAWGGMPELALQEGGAHDGGSKRGRGKLGAGSGRPSAPVARTPGIRGHEACGGGGSAHQQRGAVRDLLSAEAVRLIPHARVLRRIRELCRPAPGGTCFSGGAPAWRRRGCALAARRPGSRIHNMGAWGGMPELALQEGGAHDGGSKRGRGKLGAGGGRPPAPVARTPGVRGHEARGGGGSAHRQRGAVRDLLSAEAVRLIPHARVLRRIRELCRPAPGGTCFSGGAPAWRRGACALAARRPGSRIHNMGAWGGMPELALQEGGAHDGGSKRGRGKLGAGGGRPPAPVARTPGVRGHEARGGGGSAHRRRGAVRDRLSAEAGASGVQREAVRLIPHARVLRRIRELCRPAPGETCFSGGAPAWRRGACALAARGAASTTWEHGEDARTHASGGRCARWRVKTRARETRSGERSSVRARCAHSRDSGP